MCGPPAAYDHSHNILVMAVNIFLGDSATNFNEMRYTGPMTGKSDKDNVVAMRKTGRPRKSCIDIDALQAPPPVKTAHKSGVDASLYEQAAKELNYNPETGVFTWRTTNPYRSRFNGKVAGSPIPNGHIFIMFRGRNIYAHRLAWFIVHGEVPAGNIDHINRDPADNRIANLRLATFSQNSVNIKYRGRHLRGVSVDKNRPNVYRAQIHMNRVRFSLGVFKTEQEAHEAYLKAAQKLHGEFACNAKDRDD